MAQNIKYKIYLKALRKRKKTNIVENIVMWTVDPEDQSFGTKQIIKKKLKYKNY